MNKYALSAIKFLYTYYEDAKKYVADSAFYTEYTEEKIHHSMQVVGAMKYIMKHEPTFSGCDENFLNCAKIATILHDVGRFEELKRLYDAKNGKSLWNSELDHGYLGYEILKNSSEYNDPRIYLPVKHHGHMIERLYEDEEFVQIEDEALKKQIEQIIFLVRDADKTANYYLLIDKARDKFYNIFKDTYSKEENALPIMPDVLADFADFQVISNKKKYNYATRYLNILSWLFDINYLPSIELVIKNGALDKLIDFFCKIEKDAAVQNIVRTTINRYLCQKNITMPAAKAFV